MTIKKQRDALRRAGVSPLILRSREIGAAEFKARCLEVMDEVQRSGISVTITKHRRPVARLVPARQSDAGFCGSLAGRIVSESDLVSPIDERWEAD